MKIAFPRHVLTVIAVRQGPKAIAVPVASIARNIAGLGPKATVVPCAPMAIGLTRHIATAARPVRMGTAARLVLAASRASTDAAMVPVQVGPRASAG